MEFFPGNFQQCADLVCYYNANKFHYLYVSTDEQVQRFVDIMSCEEDSSLQTTFPLAEGRTGPAPADFDYFEYRERD